MTHSSAQLSLDYNHHYSLNLEYDSESRILSGKINGPVGSTGIVESHLLEELLSITHKGKALQYDTSASPPFTFTVPVAAEADGTLDLDIGIGRHPNRESALFAHLHCGADGRTEQHLFHQLTVLETRMLGNEVIHEGVPYFREGIADSPSTMDLHTHSSGQISAQGLIEVALDNDVPYPTRLLDELKISYPRDRVVATERIFFPPTDAGKTIPKMEPAVPLDALSPANRKKLEAALAIPPDRQITFGKLELSVYRYRTPITKSANTGVAYETWLKTAEEYAKQGITYAEITATSPSLLTPDYIEFLHYAIPKIEEDTGVKLRFLAGIPRNFSPEAIDREVEKIKIMGASPYIVGIDFMGFENNKTIDMERHIKTIAEWAHKNDPGFTLRIHAGENRKNLNNVKESLRLAKKHRLRVRIGHAAHGLDDEAIADAAALATMPGMVMIEFNPDSNMALNNIDRAEDLNLVKCVNNNIPFTICSDGGGLYQTDRTQLWHAANFAATAFPEIDAERLAQHIRDSENAHRQYEEERFEEKKAKLPDHFIKQIREQYALLPPPVSSPSSPDLKAEFQQQLEDHHIALVDPQAFDTQMGNRKPLMILGARGKEHWDSIDHKDQEEIERAVRDMLEQLDPRKVYLAIGRPKDNGIARVVIDCVKAYNAAHTEGEQFVLVSATAQAEKTAKHFVEGITHVVPLDGDMMTVPEKLVQFVKQRSGHIVFISGYSFTRDAILAARDEHVPFGLMVGPRGASTDKARVMNKDHQIQGPEGLIDYMHDTLANWFRPSQRLHDSSSVNTRIQ